MKKGKKGNKKILLICVGICILIVLILLITENNDFQKNDKTLILECSKTLSYESYEQVIKTELYESTKDTYFVQKIIMRPNVELDDEIAESILAQLKDNSESNFNKFYKGNKFIQYNVYRENNDYISEISYIINTKNSEEMASILKYNYLDNSIDNIISNIEKGGLVCSKH